MTSYEPEPIAMGDAFNWKMQKAFFRLLKLAGWIWLIATLGFPGYLAILVANRYLGKY